MIFVEIWFVEFFSLVRTIRPAKRELRRHHQPNVAALASEKKFKIIVKFKIDKHLPNFGK